MSICIVDTTVFCNILKVPHLCQDAERALRELEEHIRKERDLLLPMATIYETGNHVAQNGSGRERRETAIRFSNQVKAAMQGQTPFEPTHIHDVDEIVGWLDDFPDEAARGIGLGDRSIISTWKQQCKLHEARRVFIWAYDSDLQGYDREAHI